MIGEIGNFKMKKLLLILLCLPMIGFGQDNASGNCVNGYGTYSWWKGANKGDEYAGNWKDGKPSGLGTYTWGEKPNKGDKYVGEWKEGLRHGQGTHTFANGVVQQGLWKDDQFLELLMKEMKVQIKTLVEEKIDGWQQKGEFEKTNDYLVRVNEKNRTVKIKEFQEGVIYNIKSDFFNSIDLSQIELNEYDADNETFLLNHPALGDFILSIPVTIAPYFKSSFSNKYKSKNYNSLGGIIFNNFEFIIIEDALILSHLDVVYDNNTYSYDINKTTEYVITDIEYEFSSIEIDDIKSSKTTKSSRIGTNNLKVGTSSVNINIPTNKKVKNRYALVIGNEDYTSFQTTLNSEQNVDYAVNDATIFKEYCLKTLGVKEDNMFFITNATAGKMYQEIKRVTEIVSALGNNAELIFYYAGHGYPDEITKSPYLIPVDVSGSDMSYAVKLDDLYKTLGETNAKRITIFLDACFTGGGRTSGLVASRGVKVKPKEGSLSGNLVVFSASSGEQSALPYSSQNHGVFTYHLLKNLKDSNGSIKYGELFNNLEQSVNITSLKENSKKQNPKVNTSSKVINDWRNWKF